MTAGRILDAGRLALAPVNRGAATEAGLPRALASIRPGVALTFDDGPHPEGTPAVLELLARAGARATFFVVGEQVLRRPQLLARIASGGHVIALHGHRHLLQVRRSRPALADDLGRGVAAIEDAVGRTPAWHRPPYGIYAAPGLAFVRAAGLRPILWSRWGKDWRRLTTAQRIAARATAGIIGGDVILLHDADFYSSHGSHRRTEAALAIILAELERRKLGTVPLV